MKQTLFIIISKKEWSNMQENKFLSRPDSLNDDDYDLYDEPMDQWMLEQMRKRLPNSAFHPTNPEANGSHFMFLRRDDIYSPFCDGRVMLEIEIPEEHVIYFDDHDYIMVVNNICNGWKKDFLASTQQEADEMENASPEEVEESWLRMFDITRKRDIEYVGSLQLRAMTPCILLDMVKSYTIM